MTGKPNGLRIAFAAGLSEKKLTQKIAPLAALDCVERIDVYRREPFSLGDKIYWSPISAVGRSFPILGEAERALSLFAKGRRHDLFIGCFQLYHGVWSHLAGKLHNKPVVQLVITDVDWNMERPLATRVMLGADACGVRGGLSLEKLRERGYSGPAAVIHNPFSRPRPYQSETVEKMFDVVAVGNFAEEKDYPLMLEVLAEVKKRRYGLRAAICGDGFPALASELSRLGLENDVEFPGLLDESRLSKTYSASRMLLMTSKVEGLPMVAVEAMAHGLPVVAPNVGELPWLVREGREGRLVGGRSPKDYASALCDYLEDDDILTRAGENAFRRIESLADKFEMEAISSEWMMLLRALGLAE